MSDFQQQYKLWKKFLDKWPISRLAKMKLDEFTKVGSKDSFTYWIESHLDEMGSIRGGSAFKFGVFSRGNNESRVNSTRRSYSETHGWYTSLGETVEEAFEKVRNNVMEVARLADQGDLDGIETIRLGRAVKWKIAFHYQNQKSPAIVNVFNRGMLAKYVGGTDNQSMADLQRAAIAKKPADLGILEFGPQVWGASEQIKVMSNQTPPVHAFTTTSTLMDNLPATCFNRIYYGPPGTGKTFILNELLKKFYGKKNSENSDNEERYSFATFHQSYGYEEFVEGLRPVLGGEIEAGDANEVQYEIRSGVFKELCDRARKSPNQRFAMVIDEINRGNISKIFGELITLIEPDKREEKENAVPLILPYSRKPFLVPDNIDIIGTMNTADRSLALLDTALRRRFEFVQMMPDTRDEAGAPLAGLFVTTAEGDINVCRMLQRINERIEVLYDRDHCIGHAYLTELIGTKEESARFEALQAIFRTRILPLLEEYFFEDWGKIRLVLGDNQKQDLKIQFVSESDTHEQDLAALFGSNHGLDSYATQRRYSLQDEAFSKPLAYIGIYNP